MVRQRGRWTNVLAGTAHFAWLALRRAGKPYTCQGCRAPIPAGARYYAGDNCDHLCESCGERAIAQVEGA